jgi:hypothetical protein
LGSDTMEKEVLQTYGDYLIHLISSILNDEQPGLPPSYLEFDWGKLYNLAKMHSVENTVCYALTRLNPGFCTAASAVRSSGNKCFSNNPVHDSMSERMQDSEHKPIYYSIPNDALRGFEEAYKKAIYKEAVQHIEVEKILCCLEEMKIRCMPLKGYLMKYLYLKPDMRSMADIDILIDETNMEQISKLMIKLGYDEGNHQGAGNHYSFFKKPFMNVEYHLNLIAKGYTFADYFNPGWQHAVLKENCKFVYEMTHEKFYMYMIAHLAKHYLNSGSGIRSIMDIWVYNKRHGNEINKQYIDAELSRADLAKFANAVESLSEVWFGKKEPNALDTELGDLFIKSGTYGTFKNAANFAVSKQEQDSNLMLLSEELDSAGEDKVKVLERPQSLLKKHKRKYMLKLLFPPIKTMRILYPFLDKLLFLLPVTWVLRGIKRILFSRARVKAKLSSARAVKEEDISRIKWLNKELGLRQ